MTTYTHAGLSAAIDKARRDPAVMGAPAHNAHLDTLAAILETTAVWRGLVGGVWDSPADIMDLRVAQALTRMGAL